MKTIPLFLPATFLFLNIAHAANEDATTGTKRPRNDYMATAASTLLQDFSAEEAGHPASEERKRRRSRYTAQIPAVEAPQAPSIVAPSDDIPVTAEEITTLFKDDVERIQKDTDTPYSKYYSLSTKTDAIKRQQGAQASFIKMFDGLPRTNWSTLNNLKNQLIENRVFKWDLGYVIDALAQLAPHERIAIAEYVKDKIDGFNEQGKAGFINMLKGLDPRQWDAINVAKNAMTNGKDNESYYVFNALSLLEPDERIRVANYVSDKMHGMRESVKATFIIMFKGLNTTQWDALNTLAKELQEGITPWYWGYIFDALSDLEPNERLPIAQYVKGKEDFLTLTGYARNHLIKMFGGLSPAEMDTLCAYRDSLLSEIEAIDCGYIFAGLAGIKNTDRIPFAEFIKDKLSGMNGSTRLNFIQLFMGSERSEWDGLYAEILPFLDDLKPYGYCSVLNTLSQFETTEIRPILEYTKDKIAAVHPRAKGSFIGMFKGVAPDHFETLNTLKDKLLLSECDKVFSVFDKLRELDASERIEMAKFIGDKMDDMHRDEVLSLISAYQDLPYAQKDILYTLTMDLLKTLDKEFKGRLLSRLGDFCPSERLPLVEFINDKIKSIAKKSRENFIDLFCGIPPEQWAPLNILINQLIKDLKPKQKELIYSSLGSIESKERLAFAQTMIKVLQPSMTLYEMHFMGMRISQIILSERDAVVDRMLTNMHRAPAGFQFQYQTLLLETELDQPIPKTNTKKVKKKLDLYRQWDEISPHHNALMALLYTGRPVEKRSRRYNMWLENTLLPKAMEIMDAINALKP